MIIIIIRRIIIRIIIINLYLNGNWETFASNISQIGCEKRGERREEREEKEKETGKNNYVKRQIETKLSIIMIIINIIFTCFVKWTNASSYNSIGDVMGADFADRHNS